MLVVRERTPAVPRREAQDNSHEHPQASLVALLHAVYTGRVVAVFDGSLMAWGRWRRTCPCADTGCRPAGRVVVEAARSMADRVALCAQEPL